MHRRRRDPARSNPRRVHLAAAEGSDLLHESQRIAGTTRGVAGDQRQAFVGSLQTFRGGNALQMADENFRSDGVEVEPLGAASIVSGSL